eukprot:3486734-Pleurochrysis_carterae.AAC.1
MRTVLISVGFLLVAPEPTSAIGDARPHAIWAAHRTQRLAETTLALRRLLLTSVCRACTVWIDFSSSRSLVPASDSLKMAGAILICCDNLLRRSPLALVRCADSSVLAPRTRPACCDGVPARSLALTIAAAARCAQVRPGEPWTRQRSAIDSTIRIALRAGVYCTKYIGGYIYSKAHKGRSANGSRSFDTESTRGSAQRHTMRTDAPITPVSGTEQARALRLSLLLLSHRFWLPVASASRQLPKRTGDCGAVDEHCLGVEATDLWAIMTRARRLVLASLLRPRRLAGLRDHEWQACEASTPHRGASAASGEREGELAIEDTSADSANPSTLWAARLSTPIAQMRRAASID